MDETKMVVCCDDCDGAANYHECACHKPAPRGEEKGWDEKWQTLEDYDCCGDEKCCPHNHKHLTDPISPHSHEPPAPASSAEEAVTAPEKKSVRRWCQLTHIGPWAVKPHETGQCPQSAQEIVLHRRDCRKEGGYGETRMDFSVVKRFRIHWWTAPTVPGAYTKVKTLSCHHEPGQYSFDEQPSPHAVDVRRLKPQFHLKKAIVTLDQNEKGEK